MRKPESKSKIPVEQIGPDLDRAELLIPQAR
jgi:hypothetical protein